MLIKNKILILSVFLAVLSPVCVSASNYTPNNNLFEGTYSNNLIDMAMSQIDNFVNKKYAIFQIDYDYYLVSSKTATVSSSYITFTDSTIIRASRIQSGYSTYYDYYTYTEPSTSIYLSNVIISNLDSPKAISSKRFKEYWSESYTVLLLTVILGIIFAIFLTKGRSYL